MSIKAEVAHQINFNTTDGFADTGSASYAWQRIGKKAPANINDVGAPVWSAFVPAQHRVYYETRAWTSTRPVRWFDTQTHLYVEGTGTGRSNDSDSSDNGIMFFVPSRNLIVYGDYLSGFLRIRCLDVSVAQPSWGSAVVLNLAVPIEISWAAALWCEDNNRILVGNVKGDDNAIYEIAIPSALGDIWTVERVPLQSGDTITWAPSATYKKWFYNPKIRSVFFMPYANPSGGDDTVFVYRPRGT